MNPLHFKLELRPPSLDGILTTARQQYRIPQINQGLNQYFLFCFKISSRQVLVFGKATLSFHRSLLLIGAMLLSIQASQAHANAFTSEEFLGWEPRNQAFYIEASVGMASLIAGQRDTAQGRCIDDWYYSDEAAGTASILGVMRENPRYHPRGIVLAVLQKRCGPIGQ